MHAGTRVVCERVVKADTDEHEVQQIAAIDPADDVTVAQEMRKTQSSEGACKRLTYIGVVAAFKVRRQLVVVA